MSKNKKTSFRVSDSTLKSFDQVCGQVGIGRSELLVNCMEAVIRTANQTGYITLPLAIIPQNELQRLREAAQVVEPALIAVDPKSAYGRSKSPQSIDSEMDAAKKELEKTRRRYGNEESDEEDKP